MARPLGAVARHAGTATRRIRHALASAKRGDLGPVDRYMAAVLPLVFAGFFVLDKTPHRTLIYLFCLLPMLLYVQPVVFRAVRREPLWWLSVGLCALWLASIAWSANLTRESIFDTTRTGLAVALFVHAGTWLALQGRLPVKAILNSVMLVAGVLGALTIFLTLVAGMTVQQGDPIAGFDFWRLLGIGIDMQQGGRLAGFGWASHVGIGGDIYAFAGVVAAVAITQTRDRTRQLVLTFVLAVCAFYAVLTESRGAVLALVTATGVLAAIRHPRHILTLAAVVLLGALAVQLAGLVDFENWISRGSSHRMGIWAVAWDHFAAHPLLGMGAADVTLIEVGSETWNSAHNIFLAMAMDLGLLGLALFTVLSALAGYRAWTLVRSGQRVMPFTLLAFAYAVMLLHTQSVLLMPAREWLIFWLPLLILLHEHTLQRRRNDQPDRGNGET